MVVIRRSEGTGAVRAMRRKKAGSNPTDRRKLGSKHHLIVDAQGIPLAVILSGANSNDFMELDPLVEAIPPIREKSTDLQADSAVHVSKIACLSPHSAATSVEN